MAHLKQFKKHTKIIVPIREQEMAYYKSYIEFLIKYEEVSNKKGMDEFSATLITGEAKKIDMKEKLQKLVFYQRNNSNKFIQAEDLQNPFLYIRNWIKGEQMDIGAILETITRKENLETLKINAMSKVKNDRVTAEKMGSGKFTMTGMFKGKDGKAQATQSLLQ